MRPTPRRIRRTAHVSSPLPQLRRSRSRTCVPLPAPIRPSAECVRPLPGGGGRTVQGPPAAVTVRGTVRSGLVLPRDVRTAWRTPSGAFPARSPCWWGDFFTYLLHGGRNVLPDALPMSGEALLCRPLRDQVVVTPGIGVEVPQTPHPPQERSRPLSHWRQSTKRSRAGIRYSKRKSQRVRWVSSLTRRPSPSGTGCAQVGLGATS